MSIFGKAHHSWLGDFLGKAAHEVEHAFTKAGHEVEGAVVKAAHDAKSIGIGVGEKVAKAAGSAGLTKTLQKVASKVEGEVAELAKPEKFLKDLKSSSKLGTLAAGLVEGGIDIVKVAEGKMTFGQAVTDTAQQTGITALGNEVSRFVQKKLPQELLRTGLDKKVEALEKKVESSIEDVKHLAKKQVSKIADKFKTLEETDLPEMEEQLKGAGESVAKAMSRGGMESALESAESALPEIGMDGAEIAVTEELAVDGAAAGSVEPGGGTVLGAAIGLGVGIGVGVAMNELLKTKEGQKISKAVSDTVQTAGEKTVKGGKKAIKEVEKEAKKIASGAKKAGKKIEEGFEKFGDELKHLF